MSGPGAQGELIMAPLATVHDLGTFAAYAMDRWLDPFSAGNSERFQQQQEPVDLQIELGSRVPDPLHLGVQCDALPVIRRHKG
jgi:hypothetical protein